MFVMPRCSSVALVSALFAFFAFNAPTAGAAGCNAASVGGSAMNRSTVASCTPELAAASSRSVTLEEAMSPAAVTSTSTEISSSRNPATAGETVVYMATVSPAPDGGTVSFSDDEAAIAGCQSVTVVSGEASCKQTVESPGVHSIQASYSGDASYAASSSGTYHETVTPSIAPPPSVTSVTPSGGPASGGTEVTLTGSNFSDAYAVSFGSASASFVVDSDTMISAVAPAGSGTVDVTVSNPGGTSSTSAADQYHYFGPPSATITTPAEGASYGQGQYVTASYSCTEAEGGPGLKPGAEGCSGTVPNGAPIETSQLGRHVFEVTATSKDGLSTTETVTYTVVAVKDLADLRATISGCSSAAGGSTFTETISVYDAGPAAAEHVTVALPVPPDLTVSSAPGASESHSILYWTAPLLQDGAPALTYHVTFKVAPRARGATALLLTAFSAVPDPDLLNNVSLAIVRLT